MAETINQRWLIRQWVIAELSSGADPSPSRRVISSHWLQYDSYDHETPDAPYKPDTQAAAVVERVWIAQPPQTRKILRPFYFERGIRASNQQFELSTLFESKAWNTYERQRDEEDFGLTDPAVHSAP